MNNQKLRDAAQEAAIAVIGCAGAVGMMAGLAYLGHSFDIELLQSQGGLLISVILLGEFTFIALLVALVLKGDL